MTTKPEPSTTSSASNDHAPRAFEGRDYQWAQAGDANNLIGGRWQSAEGGAYRPVVNPRYGESMGRVAWSGAEEVDRAVRAADEAQRDWGAWPVRERAQVLFRWRALLERDLDALSWLLSHENGKTIGQARAEYAKAIECLEMGIAMENMAPEGILEVSRGVTCQLVRAPLGVVAGIVPFNFPSMVPMWMLPLALVAGNAMVMKPSERVPFSLCHMAKLASEAGLPDGVLSLVQGGREAASALVDHEVVRAVGFVGSTPVARALYARGGALGKSMLCLGGAKNHLVVVPDADVALTADNVVASYTGCAGQRCMAAAVLIAVGEVEPIIEQIVSRSEQLVMGRDVGAIVTPESRDRITGYIDDAAQQGAALLVDGRNPSAPEGSEGGYWVGPTIIDGAKPEMACACDEIFGPVLTIVRVDTLDEAIALENASAFGNAASIYTTSGAVAQYALDRFESGMCGVNIGVPVPREPFAFGGWNDSKFGHGDMTGTDGYRFWTRPRKITTKWAVQSDQTWMS